MDKSIHPGNAHGNHSGRQGQGFKQGPEHFAEKYVPDIQLLLAFETASTKEINTAIERIQDMVKSNFRVSAHQIRNIYTLILDTKNIRHLNLIRPKLAYIAARQKDDHGKVIVKVIDSLIVHITNEQNSNKQIEKFKGLKYIMESIVAYHKFYVKE